MNKYNFNDATAKEINRFKKAMETKGLEHNTARQNGNYAGIFLEWCKSEGMEKEDVRYNDMIAFIRHLQEKEYKSRFINRILLAVRHYYDFLNRGKNPASGIYLRGNRHALPPEPADYGEIIRLYETYETSDNRGKRNRVILGLMIYQALSPDELVKLETGHIRLRQAKIHIPGSRKTNPRTLDMQAVQLLDMQEYLQEIRPQMLREVDSYRGGRKPQEINREVIQRQLFFSLNGSEHIKSSIYHLFAEIKKTHPKITSSKVIWQAVIAHWLKEKGIRQVQYMAGHRYVSSTQRYRDYNMEDLAHALKSYHPLK